MLRAGRRRARAARRACARPPRPRRRARRPRAGTRSPSRVRAPSHAPSRGARPSSARGAGPRAARCRGTARRCPRATNPASPPPCGAAPTRSTRGGGRRSRGRARKSAARSPSRPRNGTWPSDAACRTRRRDGERERRHRPGERLRQVRRGVDRILRVDEVVELARDTRGRGGRERAAVRGWSAGVDPGVGPRQAGGAVDAARPEEDDPREDAPHVGERLRTGPRDSKPQSSCSRVVSATGM